MTRLRALVTILAASAVVAATGCGSSDSTKVEGGKRVQQQFAGIAQSGVRLGNPKAPVVLVEIADLKCPESRAFALDVLPGLIDRYVRSGKLQVVVHNVGFVGAKHAPGDATAAARMAAAAGLQNRGWQFAQVFFRNQRDPETRYASDAYLRRIGAAVPGLDVDRALRDRTAPAARKALANARAAFAPKHFNTVPSFLIGSPSRGVHQLDIGATDAAGFHAAIDRELR
jgi:protein-disulfide isomerase